MICPRCSVADISPASGACELCGFVPDGSVAVAIPQPDATDQLAREQLAHQFRLDVLLGHGAHSASYLAREGNSSHYVVLKVMPRSQGRDPEADERFRNAAELVATLDHPHIVAVNRFGASDSLFWYTMDHVRARSLREILRSRGPLDLKTCQRLVAQIASALDYAHRRGVVHGALKPENVLVDPNGWVHVSDLLVARAIDPPPRMAERPAPRPTPPGTTGGRTSSQAVRPTPPGTATPRRSDPVARPSGPGAARPSQSGDAGATPRRMTPDPSRPADERRPDYSAPEDIHSGSRTAFSDQYALAVLVHECLAGAPPSAGAAPFEPPATLASVRPDLPAHVTHSVQRAMSQKPAERYPSVLDFAMALETGSLSLTDSQPSGRASDVVLTVPDWQPPPGRRPRWLMPAIGIAVLAVVGWVAWPHLLALRGAPQWESLGRPAAVVPADTTRLPVDSAATPWRAGATTPPAAAADRRSPPARSATSRGTPEASSRSGERRPAARRTPSSSTPAAAPASAPAASPAAGETGRLFVNASPWGQVLVDGQPVGNTPRANLQVSAGSHTIRVVRDGFEPFERTVQVGAGETVRLTDIVLTPRP